MKRLLLCLAVGVACGAAAENVKGFPGTRYALVIGIQTFKDQVITPLRYCVDDAKGFYDLITDPRYGEYPKENAWLLLNADATAANITAKLKELAQRATKDDTVAIFFSSHGFQDAEGRSYWVTADAQVLRANLPLGKVTLAKNARLDNESLASLLDAIQAERLVVFIDCCFSADTVLRTTRGVDSIVATRTGTYRDPFRELKGKGRVIISSSDGKERSAELPDKKHGAFTYYLLHGLSGDADANRDNVVEVIELWNYLEKKVEDAARALGVVQKPTMTLTKFTHEFPLTTYPLLAASATLAPEPAPQAPSVPEPSAPKPQPPAQAPPASPATPAVPSSPEPKPQPVASPPASTTPEQPKPAAPPTPQPRPAPQPGVTPQPLPTDTYVQVGSSSGNTLHVTAREVTNAEFAEFVKANPQWSKGNIDARYHDGDYLKHWNGDSFPEGAGDLPVVYVSWFAAKAYAEWRGARLLTEAEWESSARGPGKTNYPWGNDWDAARCNTVESGTGKLEPANAFEPGGVDWSGKKILNLAGNAWEWCDDLYFQYDLANPEQRTTARAIKGGSFLSDRLACLVSAHMVADPKLCSEDGGIRICR